MLSDMSCKASPVTWRDKDHCGSNAPGMPQFTGRPSAHLRSGCGNLHQHRDKGLRQYACSHSASTAKTCRGQHTLCAVHDRRSPVDETFTLTTEDKMLQWRPTGRLTCMRCTSGESLVSHRSRRSSRSSRLLFNAALSPSEAPSACDAGQCGRSDQVALDGFQSHSMGRSAAGFSISSMGGKKTPSQRRSC